MGDNISISSGMNQSSEKSELPFERGSHLFSSRCAEAFEAIQKSDRAKCILWMLRYPVDLSNSKKILERFEKIKKLKLPISKILKAQIDSNGVVYILLEYEKLTPLMDSTWVPIELEENFILALKAVEELHRDGIVFGDISEHAFFLTQDKKVTLGSLLGDYDFAAQNTAQLPPAESINFVAPERNLTARCDISSDIYGLGVYLYRLFTGQYPKFPIAKPSSFRSDLPVWVDAVVGKCLLEDPSKRFKDVNSILREIEGSIKSGKAPEISGLWSVVKKEETKQESKTTKELIKVKSKPRKNEDLDEDAPVVTKKNIATSLPSNKNVLMWLFALVMGLGIAGFVFLSIDSTTKPESTESDQSNVSQDVALNDPIVFIAEYASDKIKDQILKLADINIDTPTKIKLLKDIIDSGDPAAFDVIVAVVQSNYDLAIRSFAKKKIVEYLESHGLTTTSGLMQDWINFQTQLSGVSTHIFRAVDSNRPARSRVASLLEASNKDLILALKFSAALAIDENDPVFVDNLRAILAKQSPNEKFEDKGIGALLVSNPSLSIFLDRNFSETLSRFSDQDLTWSLLKATESDLPIMRDLAQEVIRRNILSPYQMVFIGTLVREIPPGKTSHMYDRELVLAALDKIQSSDLSSFARWDSLDAERVLLAICASSSDPNVSKDAFDILAAKSLKNRLAYNFIAWVKSGFWEYRARMAKAIAILSMSELASTSELEQALDNLMPFSKGGLFKVIASSNDLTLIKESLNRMGALLSSDDLVSLLSNENKEIRIEAIRGLKGRNELNILKEIVKAYDAEKDSDVRKVYNEVHWVTKNRKGF